jgi:hypothetical protein
LGDSEYALALSRVKTPDAAAIVEAIQQHRKQFEDGKITSIGSATFAPAEQWKALAAESERAARNELLESSSELTEVNELERKAEEARQAADKANRELESAFGEFSRIPERADAIKLELDGIAKLLSELEIEKIEADFKQHYKAMLNGWTVDPFTQTTLAGLLVTCELRKECLNENAEALNKDLGELKARSKLLAKQLGQPKHQI